jgi:hypothetical protein
MPPFPVNLLGKMEKQPAYKKCPLDFSGRGELKVILPF